MQVKDLKPAGYNPRKITKAQLERLKKSLQEFGDLSGAAFLHSATGADYAAQILAEQKQVTERNVEEWVNVHQRANHLLDAELLAACCAEMEFPGGGLRLMGNRAPGQNKATGRRVLSRGVE